MKANGALATDAAALLGRHHRTIFCWHGKHSTEMTSSDQASCCWCRMCRCRRRCYCRRSCCTCLLCDTLAAANNGPLPRYLFRRMHATAGMQAKASTTGPQSAGCMSVSCPSSGHSAHAPRGCSTVHSAGSAHNPRGCSTVHSVATAHAHISSSPHPHTPRMQRYAEQQPGSRSNSRPGLSAIHQDHWHTLHRTAAGLLHTTAGPTQCENSGMISGFSCAM